MLSDHGPTDVVTAAIVPMDGVTRLPIRSGVIVELWDQVREVPIPKRIIRNLSGHLVLVNEPPDRELTFRIDARAAGYRGPTFDTFNPATQGVRRVVRLEPATDAVLPANATVLHGIVVRSSRPRTQADGGREPSPVAGITVAAQPPAGLSGHQFPATTDDRGAFVLVVGLRPILSIEPVEPVKTTIDFSTADRLLLTVDIELHHGRTHLATTAIDLDDANQTVLTNQETPEGRSP